MYQKVEYFILFGILIVSSGVEAEHHCTQWLAKIISSQGKVDIQYAGESIWQAVNSDQTFCDNDKIRTRKHSRVTILLRNESRATLKQSSTLIFLPPEEKTSSWYLKLLEGASFFRSREPQRLNIQTPFINAVHQGTEFLVTVDSEHAETKVFDGQVAANNKQGQIQINKGFIGIAHKNQAPRIKALTIRPEDAVQWTLYYPPVINRQKNGGSNANNDQQGNLHKSLGLLDKNQALQNNSNYLTYIASLLLSVGSVDEALKFIDQAQVLEPENSDALALKSVVSVVKNRQDEALNFAKKSVSLDPHSATAQIALSYAYQSQFKIESALEATQKAVSLSPDNALAWARLSELQLSTGERSEALKSAQKASELNPTLGQTQTILGFAYLAEVDIDEANTAFTESINLNSADPLARLGLGLAKIRKGNIEEGTRDLETAVSLDPDNAIMRSYLGKAYYELKNDGYAATELLLAKEVDPNDPTPWFYDAIRKQTTNRPVDALHDMQKAIELNDNRAVYRSSLLLDEDHASRNTSLARIYNDLGFDSVASQEAYNSLNYDPGSWSAHRFLSDSFAKKTRHEIARTSELLQSQLLQPLSSNPTPPRLAFSDVNIIAGTSPFTPGFNELSTLYDRNKIRLLTSFFGGNNNSLGNEAALSGLYNNIAYSFGQFHSSTDGFRENSDMDNDLYNAFVQIKVTNNLNIQVEYRHRDTQQGGGLEQKFNLESASTERREINQHTGRFGAHLSVTPNSELIGSMFFSDLDTLLENGSNITQSPIDGYQSEIQHIYHAEQFSSVTGGRCYFFDQHLRTSTVTPQFSFEQRNIQSDISHCGAYLYSNLQWPSKKLFWTLGLSYDSYEVKNTGMAFSPSLPPGADGLPQNVPVNSKLTVSKINPKVGLQWQFTGKLKLRMAYFKTVKPQLIVDQTIEPIQIAGFNQLFDDINGAQTEFFGVGLNVNLNKQILFGTEAFQRNLNNVPAFFGNSYLFDDWTEKTLRGYLYWTINSNWSFALEPRFEEVELDLFSDDSTPLSTDTLFVPLSIGYFDQSGFFAKVGVTFVHQEVAFRDDSNLSKEKEDFVITDTILGYRFPNRWGMINLKIKNIFNEKFQYHDDNYRSSTTRQDYTVPDRSILANVTLNF